MIYVTSSKSWNRAKWPRQKVSRADRWDKPSRARTSSLMHGLVEPIDQLFLLFPDLKELLGFLRSAELAMLPFDISLEAQNRCVISKDNGVIRRNFGGAPEMRQCFVEPLLARQERAKVSEHEAAVRVNR